jgi:hypothetical protein
MKGEGMHKKEKETKETINGDWIKEVERPWWTVRKDKVENKSRSDFESTLILKGEVWTWYFLAWAKLTGGNGMENLTIRDLVEKISIDPLSIGSSKHLLCTT